MAITFTICDDLAEKYRSLRLDTACGGTFNILPLGCLSWPDEHPGGSPVIHCHEECRGSIFRLCGARIHHWHTGAIPAELQGLWDEAHKSLPDWPGFRRLHLSADEQRLLADCERQVDDFFTVLCEFADEVRIKDGGAGVTEWTATCKLGEEPEKGAG